ATASRTPSLHDALPIYVRARELEGHGQLALPPGLREAQVVAVERQGRLDVLHRHVDERELHLRLPSVVSGQQHKPITLERQRVMLAACASGCRCPAAPRPGSSPPPSSGSRRSASRARASSRSLASPGPRRAPSTTTSAPSRGCSTSCGSR